MLKALPQAASPAVSERSITELQHDQSPQSTLFAMQDLL